MEHRSSLERSFFWRLRFSRESAGGSQLTGFGGESTCVQGRRGTLQARNELMCNSKEQLSVLPHLTKNL